MLDKIGESVMDVAGSLSSCLTTSARADGRPRTPPTVTPPCRTASTPRPLQRPPSTLAMGMLARLFDLHRVSTSEADTLRRKVRRKERLAAAAKRHAATIASVPLPCVLLVRPCSRLTCSQCASPNAGRS
jgi:hypothetical protein